MNGWKVGHMDAYEGTDGHWRGGAGFSFLVFLFLVGFPWGFGSLSAPYLSSESSRRFHFYPHLCYLILILSLSPFFSLLLHVSLSTILCVVTVRFLRESHGSMVFGVGSHHQSMNQLHASSLFYYCSREMFYFAF